ncbi:hypothetical protein ACFLW8_03890 [Chloroflexota bacterium]
MEKTTEQLKALIDSMVIDRIPALDIVEFIETHANGNAEQLRAWVHTRLAAMPEEFLTDAGNGEAIAAAWRHMLRYVFEWKSWIVYHNGRWMLDTAGVVRKLAVKTMRQLYMDTAEIDDRDQRTKKAKWYTDSESDKRVNAMLNHAISQPGISITAGQLDNEPWLLNVKKAPSTCERAS